MRRGILGLCLLLVLLVVSLWAQRTGDQAASYRIWETSEAA